MKQRILALGLVLMMILTSCAIGQDPGTQAQGTAPGVSTGVVATEGHTDIDDNGLCDDCGQTVLIYLDFYAVNDLHGKLSASGTQPGMGGLTTYLGRAAKDDENALFLSSGDMWQGGAQSNATRGNLITDWMNEMGFVSMTLGNHEFDWGEAAIEANAELAEFPFLAINIYEKSTNKPVDYCQPSTIVESAGLQIGIIGAIGDCYSSISGQFTEDIYFKTGEELTALVKAESESLRARGADLIVYSIHDGYGQSKSGVTSVSNKQIASYYDASLSRGYVDLVFEGHTHRSYAMMDEYGVFHLQNGGDNDGIAHAEMQVNFANNKNKIKTAEIVSSATYGALASDPLISELLAKYSDQLTGLTRVLGSNDQRRSGNELRQLIADLYLEAAMEKWGSQYDIVLGGGFLSVRDPGYLPAGQVSYDTLCMLFPFDNELVLCSIPGQYLKSQFLETSNSNYFISLSEYGQALRASVDPNATYYVMVDRYSSTYAPNHLTEIAVYDSTTFARDLLADHIEAGGLTKNQNGQTNALTVTIPEAIAIGNALALNATTTQVYRIKGRIERIENSVYGNAYIVDEQGNSFYIYGMYDSTGKTRYDAMTVKPEAGDEVVLEGAITRYANSSTVKIEIMNAKLISLAKK